MNKGLDSEYKVFFFSGNKGLDSEYKVFFFSANKGLDSEYKEQQSARSTLLIPAGSGYKMWVPLLFIVILFNLFLIVHTHVV